MKKPMLLLKDLDLTSVLPQPGSGTQTLLVLGAGASVPSAPLAPKLKIGILRGCSKFVCARPSSCPKDERLTLEVLCSLLRFRLGRRLDLASLLKVLLKSDVIPQSALLQAELIKRGLVSYIFTSNFDDLLYRACKEVGAPFRLVTRTQLEASPTLASTGTRRRAVRGPKRGDILAFHGTLYELKDERTLPTYSLPTSADARGLATPFSSQTEAYMRAVLAEVDTILFWGYSGSDHYDFSPVMSKLLATTNTVQRIYWLSFHGTMRDFSNAVARRHSALARSTPSRQVVFLNCQRNATEPLERYLSNCYPDRTRWPATLDQPTDLADLTSSFLRANSKPADRNRDVAAVREFLTDVREAQIWLVWLVIEHFHLDSLGLTSEALRNFGAYRGKGLFFGLDVERLSKAIEKYWQWNKAGALARRARFDEIFADQPPPGEPVYATLFKEISDDLEAVLQYASGSTTGIGTTELRDIDRALLSVCFAIAENYRGLIMLREFEDAFDWAGALSPRSREARRRAKRCFERSMRFSRNAKAQLSGSRRKQVAELLDLVSPIVWFDIAFFNRARVTVLDERAIADMRDVVRRQDKALHRLEGYLQAANLLQVCQRASVLVKRIYGVKRNDDAPPRAAWNLLSPSQRRRAQWALEIARGRSKEYEELTGRFDGRLLAAYDAEIVHELARDDEQRARLILERISPIVDRSEDSEDRGKMEVWRDNMKKRLGATRRVQGSSSNGRTSPRRRTEHGERAPIAP